jgi:hypothetical protein
MPPETGKQRAARIPLDYFKRPHRLERWKLGLTVLALVATVVWTASGFLGGAQAQKTFSRGPVASVHAAWDANCNACHVDFTPMNKDHFLTPVLGKSANHEAAADQKCKSCHAGPVHHANQLAASTPSCGGCHREHQGRDFSLVRLPDSDCTSCHRNPSAHSIDAAKLRFSKPVTAFNGDHPEFSLPKQDPGKLKFNHKLHLTAGQEVGFTLGRIADPERAPYADASWQKQKENSALVQLDCRSCHQLDSEATARAAGAYFLPIAYENHCKACHPLTFDPKVKGPDKQPLAVPHRLQPDDVNKFLWGAYADYYTKNNPDLDERIKQWLKEATPDNANARPLPGKLGQEEKQARSAIQQLTNPTEAFLYRVEVGRAQSYLQTGKTSCGECHHFEQTPTGSRRVVPTDVNEVWFQHARFNHASHRAVDCRACHANASDSTTQADVLIPGIANCRQCHAPPGHANGQATGGVRHDCTECHRYHNGDQPLQGLGARNRDPQRPLDAKQFLQGTGP